MPAQGVPELERLMRVQADACGSIGSELYVRLLHRMHDVVGRPGPLHDLLVPRAADPFGSALALRFLGAVHRLVLDGLAPELALQYPSTGGTPGPDLEDVFERTVAQHADTLQVWVEQGVQTNEVGRSAALLGGYLQVAAWGRPLRVLELGASAGLNLRWDAYRYRAGRQAFGPEDSPVRFDEPWEARAPRLDRRVEVAERQGCDPWPIDATTPQGRSRLRSFVWPDLPHRFGRLDAAIEVARTVPATVDQAPADLWVGEQLARPTPGVTTVVVHSIVLQYLTRAERTATVAAITQAGQAATTDAPLAWLRMEPGGTRAEVRLATWPGGADRLVATSSYHGPPVRWQGDDPT